MFYQEQTKKDLLNSIRNISLSCFWHLIRGGHEKTIWRLCNNVLLNECLIRERKVVQKTIFLERILREMVLSWGTTTFKACACQPNCWILLQQSNKHPVDASQLLCLPLWTCLWGDDYPAFSGISSYMGLIHLQEGAGRFCLQSVQVLTRGFNIALTFIGNLTLDNAPTPLKRIKPCKVCQPDIEYVVYLSNKINLYRSLPMN